MIHHTENLKYKVITGLDLNVTERLQVYRKLNCNFTASWFKPNKTSKKSGT